MDSPPRKPRRSELLIVASEGGCSRTFGFNEGLRQAEPSWKFAPGGPHVRNELWAHACYRPALPDGPTVLRHELLFEDDQRLTGQRRSIADALAMPGGEDIEFDAPRAFT